MSRSVSEPITVPADLLPGMLRRSSPAVVARGDHVGRRCVVTRLRAETDIAMAAAYVALDATKDLDAELALLRLDWLKVELAEPTGWDAAVACLAQHLEWNLGPHERALFWFDGSRWRLGARPGSMGMWGLVMWWPPPLPADPVAALRAVLLREAGNAS